MREKVSSAFGLAIFVAVTSIIAAAQEVDPKYKTADTNNAVIEGRVVLPSGFLAERPIKIILRNRQMVLSTGITNKHGEFRFDSLPEGYYTVQAEVAGDEFEPTEKQIGLGRGIVAELTLQLVAKTLPIGFSASRVVSVAELRQSVPVTARKQYDLGLKAVAKGNVTGAADYFQQALTIYPEYLAARNDLGAQYLKLKRIDEAEKDFQIVLDHDPKNFNAQFNLGLVRIERKDYADAITQLNRAIVIDSTRPVARLWIGVALLEMGDLDSAERELTKALIMGGSECVAGHYHLARIYLSRGNKKEALQAVRAYLEDAPKGEYVSEAKQLESQLKN